MNSRFGSWAQSRPSRRAAIAIAAAVLGTGSLAASAAALPPGSEYEKVSPANKGDGNVFYFASTVRASEDGRRAAFQLALPLDDSEGGSLPSESVSTLGQDGWQSRSIATPFESIMGTRGTDLRFGYQAFSSDLTKGVVFPGTARLTADAAPDTHNLFVRDFASGGYSLLTPPPLVPFGPAGILVGPVAVASTADLGHVFFEAPAQLTPDAQPEPAGCLNFGSNCIRQGYEWTDGQVRPVGILPDGTPAPFGGVIGRGGGSTTTRQQLGNHDRAISADGSRVFFTAPESALASNGQTTGVVGQLYMRENGDTTAHVSASQRSVPDPAGTQPVRFLAASADGSAVVFSSCEKLTDDSTADCVASGDRLYRYDLDSGQLTDLTTSLPSDTGFGGLVETSATLSRVYFVSTGAENNLYVWEAGEEALTTVAVEQTSSNLLDNVGQAMGYVQSAASHDGRFLVFRQRQSLPGHDNGGAAQLYLFDAQSNDTTCLSCPPAGAASLGDATLRDRQTGVQSFRSYRTRAITLSGSRVFFNARDALVPEDVNGKQDVYRYDTATGALSLVSTGRGAFDSWFGDADVSGDSAFFVTRERVVPDLDRDELTDLYVARLGAERYRPTVDRECEGDGCQGPAAERPESDVPASLTLAGAGNASRERAARAVFSVAPLGRAARSRLATRGVAIVRVDVSQGGRVTVRATARLGARRKVVATATRTVAGGRTVALKLRLSRQARAQLRGKGRLALTLRVGYSGSPRAQQTHLTLKRGGRR